MKNLIRTLFFFVPLFIITVYLQGCSSETAITSPPNTQSQNTMASVTAMTKQLSTITPPQIQLYIYH